MTTIKIPKSPPDGTTIIFWQFDSRNEGLIQHRMTFVENKTHAEVCGAHKRNGRPWVMQWRHEARYVPETRQSTNETKLHRASDWSTDGRSEDHERTLTEGVFADYDSACVALCMFCDSRAQNLRDEAKRFDAIATYYRTAKEPTL